MAALRTAARPCTRQSLSNHGDVGPVCIAHHARRHTAAPHQAQQQRTLGDRTTARHSPAATEAEPARSAIEGLKPSVSLDVVQQLDLRVGTVVEASCVEADVAVTRHVACVGGGDGDGRWRRVATSVHSCSEKTASRTATLPHGYNQ